MAQGRAGWVRARRGADGADLAPLIAAAEAAVYDLCGGWRCLGTVQGTYRMPDGSQAFDDSRQYAVLLDADNLPDLERVLADFHRQTKQESIYLEVTPDVDVRTVS